MGAAVEFKKVFHVIEWRKPMSPGVVVALFDCYGRNFERSKHDPNEIDRILLDLRDMGYINSDMETTPRGDRKVWAIMELLS